MIKFFKSKLNTSVNNSISYNSVYPYCILNTMPENNEHEWVILYI